MSPQRCDRREHPSGQTFIDALREVAAPKRSHYKARYNHRLGRGAQSLVSKKTLFISSRCVRSTLRLRTFTHTTGLFLNPIQQSIPDAGLPPCHISESSLGAIPQRRCMLKERLLTPRLILIAWIAFIFLKVSLNFERFELNLAFLFHITPLLNRISTSLQNRL